ncbi:hypothetical protein ACLM5J_17310 [Nocardioides sp. Bht2]|uniref:hypothetical protein n=1 Tax=Nocardioides sp. Bht2 TaxID=3392297 RepID=UPI0039B4A817
MKRTKRSSEAPATGVTPSPSRRRRLRRAGLAALATSCLVTAYSPLSSSASEDPDFPGLPSQDSLRGDWVGPSVTTINETARAKQWVRLPPIVLAAYNFGSRRQESPTCTELGDYKSKTSWRASVYFVSGDGASPRPYGYVRAFDVNTVAFGSIPVTATVRLAQPRDAEDLPMGGEINVMTGDFCTGKGKYTVPVPGQVNNHWWDARATLDVLVEVVKLRVDGVDLGLKPGCRTAEANAVQASAPDYYGWDPTITAEERPVGGNVMTTKFFGLANGGLLTGTVDIDAFTGCRTAVGEDVSALLTSAISGPNNKVSMRSQGLQAAGCVATPRNCTGSLPALPFPDGQ